MSLRQAGREIGLSPNALRNFVAGAQPRLKTRLYLERWLASRPPTTAGPSVAEFLSLVDGLTPDLPPREARALARHLTDDLVKAYRRVQLPTPSWVRELSRHYGTEATEQP